jgi:DNA-binding NarL/FixJ family response regulator
MFEAYKGFDVRQDWGCTPSVFLVDEIRQADVVLFDADAFCENSARREPLLSTLSSFARVIVLWSDLSKMVAAGIRAKGYHSKNDSAQALRALVRKVAAGPEAGAAPVPLLPGSQPEPGVFDVLSRRELDVASLLIRGLTSREIGANLSISMKTVEVHRHNILKKLHLTNTSAVVNFLTSDSRIKKSLVD